MEAMLITSAPARDAETTLIDYVPVTKHLLQHTSTYALLRIDAKKKTTNACKNMQPQEKIVHEHARKLRKCLKSNFEQYELQSTTTVRKCTSIAEYRWKAASLTKNANQSWSHNIISAL